MNESEWGELIYEYTDWMGYKIGVYSNGRDEIIGKEK